MSVAQKLACIRETIGGAPVTLVAVSKSVAVDKIVEAFREGVTEFGENRVQDALEKQHDVPPYMAKDIHWHFIGHLQTNKVRKVVGAFALIHSVDSLHLAREISDCAISRSLVQPILLQVKTLADPGKSGFSPEDIRRDFSQILPLPGVKVEGLMTMAPLGEPEIAEECFNNLARLREELEQVYGIKLKELSMGMSQDWRQAIKCGSTMLRLGRAVFQSQEPTEESLFSS
jgi:PLP dependent protein